MTEVQFRALLGTMIVGFIVVIITVALTSGGNGSVETDDGTVDLATLVGDLESELEDLVEALEPDPIFCARLDNVYSRSLNRSGNVIPSREDDVAEAEFYSMLLNCRSLVYPVN